MLFLLNDTVLTLDAETLSAAKSKSAAAPLRFDFISAKMGQELFSDDPLIHKNRLERAKRLAALIVSKAPTVNAALFLAPVRGCATDQVAYRATLRSISRSSAAWPPARTTGVLTTVEADRSVWKRLAA